MDTSKPNIRTCWPSPTPKRFAPRSPSHASTTTAHGFLRGSQECGVTLHSAVFGAFVHHFSWGVVHVPVAYRETRGVVSSRSVAHPSPCSPVAPRRAPHLSCTSFLRCKLLTCTNAEPHGRWRTGPPEKIPV